MIKNYLKVAWRNLIRNKMLSAINIMGLAIGMAVALLAAFWIWDELSFNHQFANHESIAQVRVHQRQGNEFNSTISMAVPVGEALRTRYAQDFKYVVETSFRATYLAKAGDKSITRAGMWVNQDFPDMLTLKMVEGSRGALKDPASIFIAQSMAKALFGNAPALNKTISINASFDLKVAGVYEDMPRNSTFSELEVLMPWHNKENELNRRTSWENHCMQVFVQVNDKNAIAAIAKKTSSLPTKEIKGWHEELDLQAMDRIHLYEKYEQGKEAGGVIDFIYLFGTIGVFILLLACINFMNLSTARSGKRAKEVGIRKTVGSLRAQLIGQFLSESVLMTFMSFALSVILVQLLLPWFNELSGKKISALWGKPLFWLLAFVFALLTGLVAGSYPAFYLSRFKPIKVLKGILPAGRMGSLPRKVLVVAQFTVSVTLIIGTMVVYRQIQYGKEREVGYNRDGLIAVSMKTPALRKQYDLIRETLLQSGVVENVAQSTYSPVYFYNNNRVEWRGMDPNTTTFFRDVNVSADWGKTIGWKMAAGRDFSKDFPTDSSAAILNEASVKIMGFTDPIGEVVKFRDKQYTVIGVVKDMATHTAYEAMAPGIFVMDGWMGTITIRLKPGAPVHAALARMEPIFKKFNPDSPFEYVFIDEEYARKFELEERIGNLATFFAALAIFISCLGLFGLASFVAEQRTKEIGVRKVLGASVVNVWHLLSKDFVRLVLISLLIAIPLSWYFMHHWLQDYDYRTTLSWWIFAAAGAGAIVITLITVSMQSVKAALMNPVKSLRTE